MTLLPSSGCVSVPLCQWASWVWLAIFGKGQKPLTPPSPRSTGARGNTNECQKRRPCPTSSAFTLVEVLATMLLIGIVIPVALGGISLATRAATQARKSVEAAALADSKLNELIATGQLYTAATSGDFGADWPDYTWQASIALAGNGEIEDLSLLSVRVSWIQRNNERFVTVSTFVYSPTGQTTNAAAP